MMKYVYSEYYATGEGMTRMILICKGISDPIEYFKSIFDPYFALGAEEVTEEDFWKKYGHLVPAYLHKLTDDNDMGSLVYYSQMHLNYA